MSLEHTATNLTSLSERKSGCMGCSDHNHVSGVLLAISMQHEQTMRDYARAALVQSTSMICLGSLVLGLINLGLRRRAMRGTRADTSSMQQSSKSQSSCATADSGQANRLAPISSWCHFKALHVGRSIGSLSKCCSSRTLSLPLPDHVCGQQLP